VASAATTAATPPAAAAELTSTPAEDATTVTTPAAADAAHINPSQPSKNEKQQQGSFPSYADLLYQVPFKPGAGGPSAIYAYPPNTIQFDTHLPPVTAVPVPFVPGALLLTGVLSARECEQIMAAAEAIGYNADVDYTFAGGDAGSKAAATAGAGAGAAGDQQMSSFRTALGTEKVVGSDKQVEPTVETEAEAAATVGDKSDERSHEAGAAATGAAEMQASAARGQAAGLVGLPSGGPAAGCVWLVDSSVLQPVYARVASLLPQELGGGALAGINARWRLYRYTPGAVYRPHVDGAWPGSGTDPKTGEYVFDAFGDRWSRLTFLVYLNEGFDGGTTTFYTPAEGEVGCLDARGVLPRQGNVLVFPHGGTEGSLVHEGSAVLRGAKYVIRTDVLYLKAKGQRGQPREG
jgi:hypothetical protein